MAGSIAMALGNPSMLCELFDRAEQSKSTLMPSKETISIDTLRVIEAGRNRRYPPFPAVGPATKPKTKK